MRYNDRIIIKKVEIALLHNSKPGDTYSYIHGRGVCGLIVAVKGSSSFRFRDGTVQRISEGDVALFSDSIAYVFENDSGESFTHYTVNFSVSSKSVIEDSIIRPERIDVIAERCSSVVKYWNSGAPSSYLRCLSALYELLADVNECEFINKMGVKTFNSVLPAIKYIDENYSRDITVDELARLCVMSVTNFRRIFLGVVGESPIQYLINVRLKRAKDMLLNTDMTVGEIAHSVGFKDVEHFCRTYKKKKGISAGAERQKERNIERSEEQK